MTSENFDQQRLQDLADHIMEEQKLLKEYEIAFRNEIEPRKKNDYGQQISKLKKSISNFRNEYFELKKQTNLQRDNTTLESFTKGNNTKKFKYACFISYRRGLSPDHPYGNRFADYLAKNLKTELFPYFENDLNSIFIDNREIPPDGFIDRTINNALCRSICMICIWIPKYFSRSNVYCAKEYIAMEKLEQKRFRKLRHNDIMKSYIIPFVLRDIEEIPSSIRHLRQQIDCEDFIQDGEGNFIISPERKREFIETIRQCAKHIHARYKELKEHEEELCSECEEFHLPDDEETRSWLDNHDID